MKTHLIASATMFALAISAGASTAHPSPGHSTLGGGEISRASHVQSDASRGNVLPVAGLEGAGQNVNKENAEAAINREFEPGLGSNGGRCSEIPPHDNHHKYSPCY